MYGSAVRVSDRAGREGPSFIAVENQRDTIENLARMHKVEVEDPIEEIDVSGGKPIDERAIGELVRRVEAGELEGIILWKLTRFSRRLIDGVTVAARVMDAGGRLLASDFDSAAAGAKLQMAVLFAMAEEELDRIGDGWKVSRTKAVARGAYPTKTPFGYRRVKGGLLVPNPERAATVRRIFHLKAEGATIAGIKRLLEADGTPAPNGSGWSVTTLRQILENRVYLGEQRHGENFNPAAHKPLVSPATFAAAQAKAERVQAHKRPRGYSDAALLVGIARCAGCGKTLKVMPGRVGKPHRYYCKNQAADGCPARAYVAGAELDAYADQWFLREIRNEGLIAEAVQASGKLDALQREVDDAEAELVRFVRDHSTLDAALFTTGVESRQAKLDLAKLDLTEHRNRARRLGAAPSGDLVKAWPSLPIVAKRRLFAAVADTVRVRKGSGELARRVQFIRAGVIIEGPSPVRVPVAK